MSGPVLLSIVTICQLVGAIVLGARLYGERRGEQVFATGTLYILSIALPVHALGWSDRLTRGSLAATTILLSALATALALRDVPERLSFVRTAATRVLLAPLDALRLTVRERSPVALGLVATYFVIAWTSFLTYVAPACGWDGLWYHDSIVGFTIQHRGFALEESLPHWHSLINGYTRGSEYFNLFPALLWDRRLLELAPSVFGMVMLPGLYALFARYVTQKTVALGLACTFVLLPAVSLQFRSTYIDVQVVGAYLAALYFATRPELRVRDAVLATLALGLFCNAKSSGLAMAIILAGVGTVRVLLQFARRAPGRTAAGLLAAGLTVALLGGPTYARNWRLHHNPMYPLVVKSERLGIDWQGPSPVELGEDFAAFWRDLISPPTHDAEWPDTRTNGYGNGPPFLVLPGALIALALLARSWFSALRRRAWPADEVLNVSWLALLTLAYAKLTPTWTWARFNLHIVVGVFALFAWLLGRDRRGSVGEGAVAALLFSSVLTLVWSQPAWSVPPALAVELWQKTPRQRAARELIPDWLPVEAVGLAREKELGPDSLVLVDCGLDFMASLWNEQYTNRLKMFCPDPTDAALALFERERPAWVVVRPLSGAGQVLVHDAANWREIGKVRGEYIAYRRLTPWPPPPPAPAPPR